MTTTNDKITRLHRSTGRSVLGMAGLWLLTQCAPATTNQEQKTRVQIYSDNSLGLVESTPPGISCGTACNAAFEANTQVTLTATVRPGTGATFLGWSNDCTGTQPTCTLTADSCHQVTAQWMPAAPPPPAPTLSLVTPASAPNSAAVPLTLTGTNFRPNATVTVGGVACGSVNVVSATQLTCTLPARPATCSAQAVVVTNSDNQTASGKSFLYRPAALAFAPTVNLTGGGSGQRQNVTADFNGDGKLDLASANFSSNDISIYINDGTGGFGAATNIPVGTGPVGLAVGDLNNDKKLDLVVANSVGNTIGFLAGNGLGGFAAPVTTTGLSQPQGVIIRDINNDGNQDLVVSNAVTNNVAVFLGNGMGGLAMQAAVSVGSTPEYLALDDVNKDGYLDLVTPNGGSNSVSYRLGAANANFVSGMDIAVGTTPFYAAVADVNSDGNPDILVLNANSSTVSVLLGSGGSGTFSPAAGSPFAIGGGGGALIMSVVDMNGDGKVDFVTSNTNSSNLSILLGNGMGSFLAAPGSPFATAAGPNGVVTGDFNGDGLVDLASANVNANNTSVRLALCN